MLDHNLAAPVCLLVLPELCFRRGFLSRKAQAVLDSCLCVSGAETILFLKCTLISTQLLVLFFSSPLDFISLGQNVKIHLRCLRFAAPEGSNKLWTCFLSSVSTFSAPSLRQRPHHYPHKQQKMPQQFLCCGYFFPIAVRLSIRDLCCRSLNLLHKK